MSLFYKICLLFIPWIVYPVKDAIEQYRLPKEVFFVFICLGMIFISFYKGLRFKYCNKWLAYFIGWGFLSILINLFIPYGFAVKMQLYNVWTIMPSIHFILLSIITFIALSYFEEKDYLEFAKILCLSSFLITAFAILQMIGLDPIAKRNLVNIYNHDHHYSAFLDNPNLVGNYISLCLPLFLLFKELRYKLGFVFVLTGLFLSESEISILACGLGILIYVLLTVKGKFKIFGFLIIAFLSGLWIWQNWLPQLLASRFGNRIICWKEAWIHFKENPLFGQGLGIFKTFDIKTSNTLWNFVHNDWLEILIGLGIIGIVLFILVIGNTLKKFNLQNKTGIAYLSVFVIFMVIMLGSFPMEIAPIGLIGLTSFWAIEKL